MYYFLLFLTGKRMKFELLLKDLYFVIIIIIFKRAQKKSENSIYILEFILNEQ